MTGNAFFHTVWEEFLDYVMREMLRVDASVNDQQFRRTPKLPSKAAGLAKVLTSSNSLMLAAFAEAARAFSPSPQPSPAGRGSQQARTET